MMKSMIAEKAYFLINFDILNSKSALKIEERMKYIMIMHGS